MDIEVADLQKSIANHTATTAILIILSGGLFVGFFVFWMNRKVTEPIARLEKSVEAFAELSHDQTDPDKLYFDDPHIHSGNEVEALSDAVAQLSIDMRDYVKKVLEEKGKVEDMKTEDNRAEREGLTEEELEIFDLLIAGKKLTRQEEQKVKLSAKNLFKKLSEEKPELMVVDWYRDEQPRAKVRSVIEQSLDADLPVSYDKDTFTAKIDMLLTHFVDMAVQGYGWVAA